MQAAEDTRQPSRRGKSAGPKIKALLIALLASVVFAAGCGGSEETQGGSAEETTTDHEARMEATKKSKESTEGEGSDREITLSLEGDAGTGFSGTCSVGDEEESFEGQVPRASLTNWGVDSWSARSRNKTAPVLWRFFLPAPVTA